MRSKLQKQSALKLAGRIISPRAKDIADIRELSREAEGMNRKVSCWVHTRGFSWKKISPDAVELFLLIPGTLRNLTRQPEIGPFQLLFRQYEDD